MAYRTTLLVVFVGGLVLTHLATKFNRKCSFANVRFSEEVPSLLGKNELIIHPMWCPFFAVKQKERKKERKKKEKKKETNRKTEIWRGPVANQTNKKTHTRKGSRTQQTPRPPNPPTPPKAKASHDSPQLGHRRAPHSPPARPLGAASRVRDVDKVVAVEGPGQLQPQLLERQHVLGPNRTYFPYSKYPPFSG